MSLMAKRFEISAGPRALDLVHWAAAPQVGAMSLPVANEYNLSPPTSSPVVTLTELLSIDCPAG